MRRRWRSRCRRVSRRCDAVAQARPRSRPRHRHRAGLCDARRVRLRGPSRLFGDRQRRQPRGPPVRRGAGRADPDRPPAARGAGRRCRCAGRPADAQRLCATGARVRLEGLDLRIDPLAHEPALMDTTRSPRRLPGNGTPRSSRSSSTTSASPPSRRTSTRSGRRTATSRRVIRMARSLGAGAARAGLAVEIVRCRTARRCSSSRSRRGQVQGRAHGAALRPPRQAARDDRLARRTGGPWVPLIEDGKLYGRGGADDGYAVFASLAAIGALQAQGVAARALRRHDRDLRGKRQLRSARPTSKRWRRAWATSTSSSDSIRLRRLRAAVGDDVAARHRRRHADGRGADRRRAFGRRERRGAVVVSHRAPASRPARGFGTGGACCRREFHAPIPEERVEQARAAADILGDIVIRKISVRRRHAADGRRIAPRRCSIARGGRRCR